MAALDRIKRKYPGAISYVEEIANAADFTDMWDHSMVYAPLPVAHAAVENHTKEKYPVPMHWMLLLLPLPPAGDLINPFMIFLQN